MKSFLTFAWPVCIATIGASGSFAVAAPTTVDTAGATACTITGYTTDRDPKGTKVRASPRADAPIVGHLPGPMREEQGGDETFNPEFDIIGSKDGWLLIRNAEVGQYGQGDPRTVFVGPGWISGKLTGTAINDASMRNAPRADARVTLSMQNDNKGWGPDSYAVVQMHGCSGAFADVSVRDMEGKVTRGWVTKLCSNQVTTCP